MSLSLRIIFFQSYLPYSSSVIASVPENRGNDSFPSGEAIGCCRTRGFFDKLPKFSEFRRAINDRPLLGWEPNRPLGDFTGMCRIHPDARPFFR